MLATAAHNAGSAAGEERERERGEPKFTRIGREADWDATGWIPTDLKLGGIADARSWLILLGVAIWKQITQESIYRYPFV